MTDIFKDLEDLCVASDTVNTDVSQDTPIQGDYTFRQTPREEWCMYQLNDMSPYSEPIDVNFVAKRDMVTILSGISSRWKADYITGTTEYTCALKVLLSTLTFRLVPNASLFDIYLPFSMNNTHPSTSLIQLWIVYMRYTFKGLSNRVLYRGMQHVITGSSDCLEDFSPSIRQQCFDHVSQYLRSMFTVRSKQSKEVISGVHATQWIAELYKKSEIVSTPLWIRLLRKEIHLTRNEEAEIVVILKLIPLTVGNNYPKMLNGLNLTHSINVALRMVVNERRYTKATSYLCRVLNISYSWEDNKLVSSLEDQLKKTARLHSFFLRWKKAQLDKGSALKTTIAFRDTYETLNDINKYLLYWLSLFLQETLERGELRKKHDRTTGGASFVFVCSNSCCCFCCCR